MADTLFTWGPANVTTLITTTQENRDINEIQDTVFNKLAFFEWMNSKKKIRKGGTSLIVPLRYQKNTTNGSYDGYDTLDTTPQNELTSAQFKWKQYYGNVSVNGREDRVQNKGKYEVIDLVKSKIDGAESALRDTMNTALFAAAPGSKDLGSLVTSIDATSTIGDVNSTSNSFWQATSTASGSFAAQGLSDMRTIWNTLAVKMPQSAPDLILTTTTIHSFYEGSLLPQQRYEGGAGTGDGSFRDLMFKSTPVRYDAQATSGVMYFLNSDVMELSVDPDTNFVMTEWVKPANQDAKVAQILFAGELVIKNRRKLGKLTAITA
jgi:hypothetical protein